MRKRERERKRERKGVRYYNTDRQLPGKRQRGMAGPFSRYFQNEKEREREKEREKERNLR